MRDAWIEFDIAQFLARKYKRLAKGLFIVQLFVSFLISFLAAMRGELTVGLGNSNFDDAAFGCAVAASVLVAVQSMVNAKLRWRHLRTSAGALESLIWCYRTRVGRFALTNSPASHMGQQDDPEQQLFHALASWRDSIILGAELNRSSVNKRYASSVFAHNQYASYPKVSRTVKTADGIEMIDDFQSPVRPTGYMEMRLIPTMRFYQSRIPKYTFEQRVTTAALLMCTAASAVLTRHSMLKWWLSSPHPLQ